MAVALAAVVLVCLRLGWWQLQRYSSGGSLQNLGYTLQWPTFAGFAVFLWWRLRRLERERQAAREHPDAPPMPAEPRAVPARPAVRASTAHQDEPDDELARYNRYLAELNASADRRNSR